MATNVTGESNNQVTVMNTTYQDTSHISNSNGQSVLSRKYSRLFSNNLATANTKAYILSPFNIHEL